MCHESLDVYGVTRHNTPHVDRAAHITQGAEAPFRQRRSEQDQSQVGGQVERILNALSIACAPSELDFQGFGYHELRHDRKGTHAVWVTRNQRVTFKWDADGPYDVELEDYHGR
jgi:toxin HigB-1